MSIRKLIAGAALAIAPVLAAAPATALSEGDNVCYAADGSAVINPANPEDFEYCVTRESSGSSEGSTLSVCSADFHSPGYNDGLGSTGPYTIKECKPLQPLSG